MDTTDAFYAKYNSFLYEEWIWTKIRSIGKYYNMTYVVFEDEHYYICHDGRELRYIRTESREQVGYTQTLEVYGCADCSVCEHKAKCLYKYDA